MACAPLRRQKLLPGETLQNIPSALSRLNIRIDGGPRGCGREARRIVYGGTYIDDERKSPRPPGLRPAGLAANAPSAASQQLKGSTDPVFAAASYIWGLCGQSILIFRRDRALALYPGNPADSS